MTTTKHSKNGNKRTSVISTKRLHHTRIEYGVHRIILEYEYEATPTRVERLR